MSLTPIRAIPLPDDTKPNAGAQWRRYLMGWRYACTFLTPDDMPRAAPQMAQDGAQPPTAIPQAETAQEPLAAPPGAIQTMETKP